MNPSASNFMLNTSFGPSPSTHTFRADFHAVPERKVCLPNQQTTLVESPSSRSGTHTVAAAQKAGFFLGLCRYLWVDCGLHPDEIVGGILSVHTKTSTPHDIPEDPRQALMAVAALATAMNRNITLDPRRGVSCWPDQAEVLWLGDTAEEFARSAEHALSEENLFEEGIVRVKLRAEVIWRLPKVDSRVIEGGE